MRSNTARQDSRGLADKMFPEDQTGEATDPETGEIAPAIVPSETPDEPQT